MFELMTHPDQLLAGGEQLEGFDDLRWWSSTPGGPARVPTRSALWRDGIDALADLGDNVVCKLSGLAMPFGSMGVDAFGPWLEYAIAAFGPDRCMFASNFPVDSMFGTFDDLYATFSAVAAGLDATAREKLFAATAERLLPAVARGAEMAPVDPAGHEGGRALRAAPVRVACPAEGLWRPRHSRPVWGSSQ